MISERVVELSRLMDKGQREQYCVPDSQIRDWQAIKPWIDSVAAWTEETNALLAIVSFLTRIGLAFMLITDAGNMDSVVYSSGRQFALTGQVRECYQRLVVQLANLRRIMEQAEVYF